MKSSLDKKSKRTLVVLSLLVLVMFGFGFAMVPLYDLFCQVTGIQSVSSRVENTPAPITTNTALSGRWVTIKFDTSIHPELPWDFYAPKPVMKVQPGKIYTVDFVAKNRSSKTISGRAIPSLAPWQATEYLKKIECFCFAQQELEGGSITRMPLRFSVSSELPKNINSLTLSYSLMNAGTSQVGFLEKPKI